MSVFLKKLEEIAETVDNFRNAFRDESKEFFENLTYDDKLKVLFYVFSVLHEHAKEGGTYRVLLYDRFGLDMDSYGILQLAGALDIHNLISGELGGKETSEL